MEFRQIVRMTEPTSAQALAHLLAKMSLASTQALAHLLAKMSSALHKIPSYTET